MLERYPTPATLTPQAVVALPLTGYCTWTSMPYTLLGNMVELALMAKPWMTQPQGYETMRACQYLAGHCNRCGELTMMVQVRKS